MNLPFRSALVAVFVLSTAVAKEAVTPAAPVALVPFADADSITRLQRSEAKADFFRLANNFETQENRGYCGPASATVVLNTLRTDNAAIEKPQNRTGIPPEAKALLPPGRDPFMRRYTQVNLFDAKADGVKTALEVFGKPKGGGKPDPGFQLRQLGTLLQAHGLAVTVRVVDDSLTDDAIRKELAANLATGGDYVIVNFFRPALGQQGGGHISPVAAYDEVSDSILLLDVNPTMSPWVWVPTSALIKSMRTHDTVENRGYLLVKEGK
jgi:hypothetical protein